MIKVNFIIPGSDPTWRIWIQRGRSARRKMWDAKKNGLQGDKFDDALYKEQRDLFLKAFHGKCAYCELRLGPGQRKGDVEHFRPKGRVTDIDGKLVYSAARKHIGYHWLAYNWHNLLPACLACNRPGTGPGGRTEGKWDRFPTEDGFWADTVRGVRKEKPLLLNPWIDDPEKHLIFDDTGVVGFKTRRGEVTIDVLGLNRDDLIDERKEACTRAKEDLRGLLVAYAHNNVREVEDYEKRLRDIFDGKTPYSAAARAAVGRAYEMHQALQKSNPLHR